MSLDIHISEVEVKDFKSIAYCAVQLRPLSFLVGPNGSGKSNFLDSLAFCADALRHSLDSAIRDRGGVNEVRRRSRGRPNHFAIRITAEIHSCEFVYYFKIAARSNGRYAVQEETCSWDGAPGEAQASGHYTVRAGKVVSSQLTKPPAASEDQLYLVRLSGTPELGKLYSALSGMSLYSINPASVRELQSPNPGDLLSRDGGNLVSVLAAIERTDSSAYQRILEYLSRIVPSIRSVKAIALGPKETLEFTEASSDERGSRFFASNMSDGTLRALGVLVALFQRGPTGSNSLVGLEEPELALHPAAAGVLYDCLREASRSRQVLVTSHSPDLLDRDDIDPESLLAVSADDGQTAISVPNPTTLKAIQDRLRTPGELLRLGQLQPKPPNNAVPQMPLF